MRLDGWKASISWIFAASLAAATLGCGGDDDATTDSGPGPGGDGGIDAGPGVDSGPGDDAGGSDSGLDTVTVTGLILGEDVGSGPPVIEGATVSIVWPDGTTFDSGVTGADGRYTVTAPGGMTMLHRVEPVTGYLGHLRGEMVRPMDYEAYELRLSERSGVETVVTDSGGTYDPTLGTLVAGYNPVSVADGGEGATLSGVTHGQAFVLHPGGMTLTNVLPPICGSGETPAADGCALDGRNNQVTFPNIVGSPVMVNIIDPAGGTCTERFGIATWPVFPDTTIIVNIDCTAS